MISSILFISSCIETSNTDRWNSFLNYGIKNPVNNEYLVHVSFKNEAQYPINIFKTNFEEADDLTETLLQVGETRKINCKIGDTFTAKVNSPGTPYDNLLLMAYDVSRVYIYDKHCDKHPLIKCNRKPFTGDMRWTPPDSLMFTSLVNYNTSLYYWDGTCEEYISSISSNNDYHIMSTVGHSFRIRNYNDDSLIMQYKFEEVVIKGLEEQDYDISERATEFFDLKLLEKLKQSVNIKQTMINDMEERLGRATC